MFVRDDEGYLGGMAGGTTVDLHTVGLRGAGVIGGFDFELEAAYQFGDVDDVPSACPLPFGEADVDFDEFAVNLEAGYTFDASLQPRIFARFAYLGGGEPDDARWSNDRTLPFNRLFSNIQYSEFLDDFTFNNGQLSNVFVYSLGIQALLTEALEMKLVGSYLQVDQEVWNADDDLGWEVGLYGEYYYSEDLVIRSGYAHFFGGDGLAFAPIVWNGLQSWAGGVDDDYDYLFLETEIAF